MNIRNTGCPWLTWYKALPRWQRYVPLAIVLALLALVAMATPYAIEQPSPWTVLR